MLSLVADVRYALRRARSRMGFTLIAIISLALGIGVNTAAFSLVNAIVLRKTPMPDPEQVVELYMGRGTSAWGPLSYPDYTDLRDQTRDVFKAISLSKITVVPRDRGDHVETIIAELVNGDFFPMIGVPPVLGRLLGSTDDVAQGAHPVAVLAYDYWQRDFGGDREVVGKEVRLSGRVYTVVGVAPRSVEGLVPGLAPAVYLSMRMQNQVEPGIGDALAQRGAHGYFAKARLADGQTDAAARAVVARYVADMRARYPDYWSGSDDLLMIPATSVAVSPLMDATIVPAASALMIVVALVLVVACANLASFLLAQARDREREIAIRLAIGAGRGALVRQLLTESLLLSLVGGALGIAISSLSLRVLLSAKLPIPLPINLDVGLDARVLGFATLASVAAAILFGLIPALQATRPNVVETIKNENAGAKPGRRFTMRSALVVAQTATSLVLLVTAALFLRSFAAQSRIDAGFGAAPAGLVWVGLPTDRFPGERRTLLMAEIERRTRELPGVEAVGLIDNLMLNALNQQSRGVNVEGFEPPKGERSFGVDFAIADSGFFDAAGIRLLAGRHFSVADNMNAPRVAIINEVMARKFWPKGNAIGSTFRQDTTVVRVIGIASNTKVRSLGEPPRPMMFSTVAQAETPTFMLVARTRGDAAALATRIVTMLRDIDQSIMVIQAKTMERHLAAMVLPARLGAAAFATFAGLALVLAMIGIYGVVRYAVSRREREVAIRLAVGAAPQSVVRLLMREGVVLVAAGAVIGIVLGALMARGLQSLLYGVQSSDPAAFIGAPLVLLGVGVLAAFLPARRASRVDPASTLRQT